MRIFGIAGWSGSGKTTLLIRLIPTLSARGLRVGTVKHTHHNPEVGDTETRALAAGGAVECLVASPTRFALIHEHQGAEEPALDALIPQVGDVDLLLVEGFKWAPHPKLEVWDPALGKSLLAVREASVVALAADEPVADCGLPRFARDHVEAIADYILAFDHVAFRMGLLRG